MFWPKNSLKSRFLTQKWPKKTVFTLKYDILGKPPCTAQSTCLNKFLNYRMDSVCSCRFGLNMLLLCRGQHTRKNKTGLWVHFCKLLYFCMVCLDKNLFGLDNNLHDTANCSGTWKNPVRSTWSCKHQSFDNDSVCMSLVVHRKLSPGKARRSCNRTMERWFWTCMNLDSDTDSDRKYFFSSHIVFPKTDAGSRICKNTEIW